MAVTSDKPIGYWVKQLDTLINDRFAQVIDNLGLTRRDWQLLNLLAVRPNTRDGLERALAPFTADGGTPTAVTKLIDMGHVTERLGELALTEAGRLAHAELTDAVERLRDRTGQDIDDDDYRVTLATLAKMCANLA